MAGIPSRFGSNSSGYLFGWNGDEDEDINPSGRDQNVDLDAEARRFEEFTYGMIVMIVTLVMIFILLVILTIHRMHDNKKVTGPILDH